MIWPSQATFADPGADDPSSSSSSSSSSASGADGPSAAGSGTRGVATAKPLRTLSGHAGRLCKVRWDVSGRLLASTGFDTTWRLWDAETGTQLLLQEGHTREAYSLAFHPDNSLLATGDFGGVIRLWDLRSGQAVAAFGGRNTTTAMNGHHGHVTSLSFSPIAPFLASGGSDNQARVWDLRKKSCAASVRQRVNAAACAATSTVARRGCLQVLAHSSLARLSRPPLSLSLSLSLSLADPRPRQPCQWRMLRTEQRRVSRNCVVRPHSKAVECARLERVCQAGGPLQPHYGSRCLGR